MKYQIKKQSTQIHIHFQKFFERNFLGPKLLYSAQNAHVQKNPSFLECELRPFENTMFAWLLLERGQQNIDHWNKDIKSKPNFRDCRLLVIWTVMIMDEKKRLMLTRSSLVIHRKDLHERKHDAEAWCMEGVGVSEDE